MFSELKKSWDTKRDGFFLSLLISFKDTQFYSANSKYYSISLILRIGDILNIYFSLLQECSVKYKTYLQGTIKAYNLWQMSAKIKVIVLLFLDKI